MPVTLDNLRRQPHRSEPQLFANDLFNARIDIRICADSAGELADGDDFPGVFHPLDIALDLRHPQKQLEPEGHRLGVNPVRPPDTRRMFDPRRPPRQHLMKTMQIVENNVRRLSHHDPQCRILDVARRQALVDVFGILAHVLGHVRQKRDNVVVRHLFNLMDAIKIKACLLADIHRRFLWDLSQLRHRLTGRNLYLENFLKLMLQRPQLAHFRIRITLDHRSSSSIPEPRLNGRFHHNITPRACQRRNAAGKSPLTKSRIFPE